MRLAVVAFLPFLACASGARAELDFSAANAGVARLEMTAAPVRGGTSEDVSNRASQWPDGKEGADSRVLNKSSEALDRADQASEDAARSSLSSSKPDAKSLVKGEDRVPSPAKAEGKESRGILQTLTSVFQFIVRSWPIKILLGAIGAILFLPTLFSFLSKVFS